MKPRDLQGPEANWRVENLLANALRAGVIVSAVVVILGAGVYLARHGTEQPDYGFFRGEPADLRSVSGIVADCLRLRGRGIIQFGVLLLIATPVVRVILSLAAFAAQRDRAYVAITLIVLLGLLYSLLGSS